jgi:hypothetical protein
MAAAEALPARNETDKRFVFRGLDLQARQTRNDSKLPATSKSLTQQLGNARLHSYSVLALDCADTPRFKSGGMSPHSK